ncbi:hypothetical protein UP09_34540 [Bradyrhizobium sp. LTSP885]|nr:hypothetical protein UP09_34540 [Bradyrhizobium sp. LTSP885]
MTSLPALREQALPEPRLVRLGFVDRGVCLTRRHFILGCLALVASRAANLFDRLAQLPLLRIRFP